MGKPITTQMKAISSLSVAMAAAMLSACLPTAQNQGGSATNATPNRFGYRGSVTDPNGTFAKPSPAPDGALAQALSPNPTSGTIAGQNSQTPPAAGSMGTSLSTPVLPTVNATPPRPPDSQITPKTTNNLPPVPVPPAPTKPQLGSTSTPPPPAPIPTTTKPKDDYPFGIPVPGKDGMVYSPYDKEAGYVDVRGMKPGALVEDPYSKKFFRVP